jgi:hypothetical protein
MRQLRSATCVALGILAWSAGSRVLAQGYIPPRPGGISPITQPVYSPYLNLLRPGGNTTQNYFGLVRPEFDLRNAAGNLQQQTYQTDLSLNNLATGVNGSYAPLGTGHVATFLNTGGHFLNLRGSGGQASLAYGAGYGAAAGYGGYGAGAFAAGAAGAGGFGAGARSFGGGLGNTGGAAGGLRTGVPSFGGVGQGGFPR